MRKLVKGQGKVQYFAFSHIHICRGLKINIGKVPGLDKGKVLRWIKEKVRSVDIGKVPSVDKVKSRSCQQFILHISYKVMII